MTGTSTPRFVRGRAASRLDDATWLAVIRTITEFGASESTASRWWNDTLELACAEMGEFADGASTDPLRRSVYRELESIERATRARTLRGLVRCAVRARTSSLAAVTLDLVAPMSDGAVSALQRELAVELERATSRALFEATPSLGPLESSDAASLLAECAYRLDPSFDGALVEIEASLVDAGAERAVDARARRFDPPVGEDPLDDPLAVPFDAPLELSVHEPAPPFDVPCGDRSADPLARLDLAIRFVGGDASGAHGLLEAAPLDLDRSAAMDALRAWLRHRSSRGGAVRRQPSPPSASERARIARFLALAAQGGER